MPREYYSNSIDAFLNTSPDEILGILARNTDFALEQTLRDAWLEEIEILRSVLPSFPGSIYFEYSIPRMGQRIDVVILLGPVIFVLEFKIGETGFPLHAVDQVWDYALDLRNFHESSHQHFIAPILIATKANDAHPVVGATLPRDKLLRPIKTGVAGLENVIEEGLRSADGVNI